MAVKLGLGFKTRDEDDDDDDVKPAKKKSSAKSRKSREDIFKEEFENSKKGSGGGDFIEFPQGTTTVRILPPVDEDEVRYFVRAGVHYSTADRKPVLCLKHCFDEECEICDLVQRARKKKNATFTQQHALRQRYWYNAVVIPKKDARDKKLVIGIMSQGKQAHNQIMGFETDEDYTNLDDLEIGRNLKITRTGEKMETKYSVLPSPKQVPLSDIVDDVDDALAQRTDLDAMLNAMRPKAEFLEQIVEALKDEM